MRADSRPLAHLRPSLPPTRPSSDEDASPETTGTRLVRRGFFAGARVGDFVLERRLGRGGMAEVWRAASVHDGSQVALKQMLPTLRSSPACRALFLEEARLGMRLRHPNLVRCLDIDHHESEPFLVLELVDGPSCAELLSVAAARRERIPLGAVLFIALETLAALAHIHAARDDLGRPLGVVHRDVSPGNVLLGRGGVVRLVDFGIAQVGIAKPAAVGVLQGKRGYMAPEQIAGEPVDLRADLFALAVLVTELATGRFPFDAGSELELLLLGYEGRVSGIDELPPALASVLGRAAAQSVGDRFRSAEVMARELMAAALAAGVEFGAGFLDATLERFGLLRGAEAANPPLRRCGIPSRAGETVTPAPDDGRAPSRRAAAVAEAARLVATGREPHEVLTRDAAALLAPLRASSAYRFGSYPKPAWRIVFRRGLVPEILLSLARARATGLLVARRPDREKRIYLEDGLPSFVASSDERELLGARLVAGGHATLSQVSEATERALTTGVRLGTALVDLGYVRPVVVVRTLISQLENRFAELAGWPDGELVFCADARPAQRVLRLHRAPEALVERALRHHRTERHNFAENAARAN